MKTAEGRALFLFCGLLTVFASVAGGQTELKDDPVYNGKPLSAWIDELPSPLSTVTHTNRPDVQAIRAIGTNAIPWLLRQLTASPWTPAEPNKVANYIHQNRARWGFWALGEIGAPAIPSLVNLIEHQPDAVPSALAGIGAPALPAIEGCLTNVTGDLSLDSPRGHSVASALGGLWVAIDTGRISTNQAAYLLPAVRFWSGSTNHNAAYWARGVLEKLSPESRSQVIAPGSNGRPRINAPLAFYLVSKQRIEGGQFFNRFPLPELGYISSNPDLVVERLKEVSSLPESSGPGWIVDRTTGTPRKATLVNVERFFFTLHDEDATRLRRLADKAEGHGQLVLGLLGDKAIVLLRPEEIPAKAPLQVIGNWGRGDEQELAEALKKLVQ